MLQIRLRATNCRHRFVSAHNLDSRILRPIPRAGVNLAKRPHFSILVNEPHGRANAEVMLGLIRWMRAHRAEITGFDVTRPVLPQLPLLSDAQLRAAFRAMDPLAR